MPKTDLTQYDKDPANNTDVDGVDIAEGCAPSGINNAIRSVMSHIAEMNDGTVAMTSPSAASLTITSVDINGGTIDGTTIGGSTPAAITGTTITGTSFVTSGNMTFGDNDKAVFGAGSDLEIYSDGDNSFISETGTTGSLYIDGTNLRLRSTAGDVYLRAVADSSVDLYYDNSIKLSTTSTGIDVTGTVTADGLTVDGDVSVSGTVPLIKMTDTDNSSSRVEMDYNFGYF